MPDFDYLQTASRLFPPTINVDSLNGFFIEIETKVGSGGTLSLSARFVLNVIGVDPLEVLSDVATALNDTLQSTSDDFGDMVSPFLGGFDTAADVLSDIADSDNIQLALDAKIDLTVDASLSLGSLNATSSLDELKTSIRAFATEDFGVDIGGLDFEISPSFLLFLEANNSAVPFDIFAQNASSNLASFDFGGAFYSEVIIGVEVSNAKLGV